MNAIAKIEQPTKLEAYQLEVLPPRRKAELFTSLPAHVKPERFERNLVNALMANPDLLELPPELVFREVSKAAALGLYLDPQLGEAYLIVGWNGRARQKEPQLRIGYRGLVKLGRQSGEISMIYAHEVHKNDSFRCVLGDQKSLIHEPDVFGDRGPIVGYYAVVKYREGETDFEPMTVAQVHAIRDRSDAWKAFTEKKIRSTPWSTDDVEMSKKTVIRRLVKRVPQSPELAEAIRIEDAAEHGDLRSVAPAPRLVPPSPTGAAIAPPSSEAETPAASAPAVPTFGEMLSDILAKIAAAETPEALDAAWTTTEADRRKLPIEMRQQVKDAAEARHAEMTAPKQPEQPTSSESGGPAASAESLAGTNPEAWLAECERRMAECSSLDALNELWEHEIAIESEDAFPPDVAEVRKGFERHEARLGDA